ncbi:MAG: DUF3788 domain-containing protein, partial [Defluviitaleaceae bacterium]|nr:DUF3788 domain-containing protein [Defluviitaleaceae bacterium]
NHEKLSLVNPDEIPAASLIKEILGGSYPAYASLQDTLPNMEMEQVWQWYTPYKAWFARGQHWWTTKRGTKKEKTLFWLYVYEGYFSIAVWFKEKNRIEAQNAHVSEATRQLIREAKTMGKLPTFPVVINVTDIEGLADVYALIGCKKELEK